jgi:hypothetical protein
MESLIGVHIAYSPRRFVSGSFLSMLLSLQSNFRHTSVIIHWHYFSKTKNTLETK